MNEAATLDADLIVVTHDSAFRKLGKDAKAELNPVLVAEAAERGVNTYLAEKLHPLITQFLFPSDPGEAVDLSALAEREQREQIIVFLEEHLAEPGITKWLDPYEMDLPPAVTDFSISYVENVHDVAMNEVHPIDNGQVVHSFAAKCDVELNVSVYEGDAVARGWPIEERYGHGEVRATVYTSAQVSGLITLSPFGLAVAAEVTEWCVDPEQFTEDWTDCGCAPDRTGVREPRVIYARLPASTR